LLAHGQLDLRDLMITSQIGGNKFLAGSTKYNIIIPVIAKPPDITHRFVIRVCKFEKVQKLI